MINFSLQNPDTTPANQPELFIAQSNQLNILFSNTLGIPNVNPGDIFTINIPDNLISSGSADQLLSKSWKIQHVIHQNSLYSYSLTPLKQLAFSGAISIRLQKLTGLTATNGDVDCNFLIGGDPIKSSSEKLFVSQAPSNKLKPLTNAIVASAPFVNQEQQQVARGTVYTSPVVKVAEKDKLTPPVANQIHLNLKFNGSQLTDKKWDNPPRFMFSFSYGTQGGDLTDSLNSNDTNYNPFTSAWNIKANIASNQTNKWQLLSLNNNSSTPVWEVEPRAANVHLFTNGAPDLDIIFYHVISALAANNATVYIQWANIPGYNPGRFVLDLPKQVPDPTIISLTKAGNNFTSQEEVRLDWQTFAVSDLELSWSNNSSIANKRKKAGVSELKNSGKVSVPAYSAKITPSLVYLGNNKIYYNGKTLGYSIPPFKAQPVCYSCMLQVPGKEDTQQSLTLNLAAATPPKITIFTIAVVGENSQRKVVASWLVETDNVNAYCELSGVNQALPLAASDGTAFSFYIPITDGQSAQSSYTLTVIGFAPQVTATVKRTYRNIQTINGCQVLYITPSSATAYCSKDDYEKPPLYYFDTMNIPTTIDQDIVIGDQPDGDTLLSMQQGSNYAFAINGSYPTPNNKLYYFDPDNPPAIAKDFVAITGFLETAIFSPDNSRIFILNSLAGTIAYFDPEKPPVSVKSQMQLTGETGIGIGGFLMTPGCKLAYFTYLTDDSLDDIPLHYFDWTNPPSLITQKITTKNGFNDIAFTPDGKTMFVGYDKKICYFPSNNPPAELSACPYISFNANVMQLALAPQGQMFVFTDSSDTQVQYFDWRDIPQKATNWVKLPLEYAEINAFAVSADGKLLLMVDDVNSKFYYVSANDPTEAISIVDIGWGPGEIYELPNGERIFINNGRNCVTVIEAAYE